MARDFYINGESMVSVKGNVNTTISALTQLGLATDPITVTFDTRYKDMIVDAWGQFIPTDVQYFLSSVTIKMNLIHYDQAVLDVCLRESMGGIGVIGQTGRAGQRFGGNVGRFAAGNHYIGLNLLSPVQNKPFRFYYAYMIGPAEVLTLGTEKSIASVTWRAVPYTNDPWGGGSAQPTTSPSTGALGAVIWDNTLDT